MDLNSPEYKPWLDPESREYGNDPEQGAEGAEGAEGAFQDELEGNMANFYSGTKRLTLLM